MGETNYLNGHNYFDCFVLFLNFLEDANFSFLIKGTFSSCKARFSSRFFSKFSSRFSLCRGRFLWRGIRPSLCRGRFLLRERFSSLFSSSPSSREELEDWFVEVLSPCTTSEGLKYELSAILCPGGVCICFPVFN